MTLERFINKNGVVAPRYERKFLLRSGQLQELSVRLRFLGFHETYKSRTVHSVYFDDLHYSAMRDNIDGNPVRDKLRVRYYDNDMSSTNIEIKHKRSYLGYKTNIPIQTSNSSLSAVLSTADSWCRQHLDIIMVPTAYVEYDRQYLECGWLRATCDMKVTGGRLIGSEIIYGIMPPYEVLEFKYPSHYDEEFRFFYRSISDLLMRNTKSSKYTNSLIS